MIIQQEIVDKAAYKWAENNFNAFGINGFRAGTEFAEQELGNIAVKFGMWLLLNAEMSIDSQGLYCYHRNTRDYTVEEIFKVFMEEEYGQI